MILGLPLLPLFEELSIGLGLVQQTMIFEMNGLIKSHCKQFLVIFQFLLKRTNKGIIHHIRIKYLAMATLVLRHMNLMGME
jgi:hypothetical protein